MIMYNAEKSQNHDKGWIPALEGLRGIAFLGVFLSHCGLGIHTGAWGVSVFLVLSGFLMYYNHNKKDDISFEGSAHILDSLKYSFRKIKKLYWLHVVTFIAMIPLTWNDLQWTSLKKCMISILKFMLNLSLMHAWIPKSEFYFSFNGVSWYLSVCVFLYAGFYYLQAKGLFRNKRKKTIIKRMLLVLAIQLLGSIVLYVLRNKLELIPVILTDNLSKWITYISPLYRGGDFLLGAFLGQIYVNKEKDDWSNLSKYIIVTVIQCLPFALLPFQIFVMNQQANFCGSEAVRYTLLYTITSIALVYGMCYRGGGSALMATGVLRFIGKLSIYGYLLHMVIISSLTRVIDINAISRWLFAAISLGVTLLCSYGIFVCKYILSKRKDKVIAI